MSTLSENQQPVVSVGKLSTQTNNAVPAVSIAPSTAVPKSVGDPQAHVRSLPIGAPPHSGAYGVGRSATSVLNIPATHHALVFPVLRDQLKAPMNPGYTEAHRFHHEMRQYFAGKAYSNIANAEHVTVKARLMTRVDNRKHPIQVSVSELFLVSPM